MSATSYFPLFNGSCMMNGSLRERENGSEQEANDRTASWVWWLELAMAPPSLIIYLFGKSVLKSVETVADSLHGDHRNDPIYTKKLQELIERNREFEKSE